MAQRSRYDRPVSDEELEAMPEKIHEAFDEVREVLAEGERSKFRRRSSSDTWHFCANCSNYPTTDYEAHQDDGEPASGKLCNECLSKEKADNCT